MELLERKALEQAIKLIESMSSYEGYKALNDLTKEAKELKQILTSKDVLAIYNENISKEMHKATEAAQWIKAVLEKENQK